MLADVYFLALEKLMNLQSATSVEIFTAEMLNLHRGQGRDIFWRANSYIASEEEYIQMVCDKTGGLFRLAIRIMECVSPHFESISKTEAVMNSAKNSPSDFTLLSDSLASYFQIRDDLINLASPKFHLKKGFCEDITEGKLSFIVLHSLRTFQQQNKEAQLNELLQILKEETKDMEKIKHALILLHSTDSFNYTIKYLAKLYQQIMDIIARLGENQKLCSLLESLKDEIEDCQDVSGKVINT